MAKTVKGTSTSAVETKKVISKTQSAARVGPKKKRVQAKRKSEAKS